MKKEEIQKAVELDAHDTFLSVTDRSSRWSRGCLAHGMIFIVKNVVALSAGWIISVIVRASLGAANKTELGILRADNGTELTLSDLLSCWITLLLCQFWVKPPKTRWKETCCNPKLVLRTFARDAIPFIIGVSTLFLTKYVDVALNGPEHVIHASNNKRLFEGSDVVGGVLLILSFHLIDRILEWKWPSDPYQDIGLFSLDETDRSMQLPTVLTERTALVQ